MRRRWVWVVGICGLSVALGLAYAEQVHHLSTADLSIGITDPRTVVLADRPIRPDWILEGHPKTTSAELAHTGDGLTQLLVWRTTAGRFNWYYDFDETVTILDGEVFLTEGANAAPGNPAERRLGPGDVVFFHLGSTATWRVPDHVRKIATIKHALPGPIASLLRWARALKGLTRSTLTTASL